MSTMLCRLAALAALLLATSAQAEVGIKPAGQGRPPLDLVVTYQNDVTANDVRADLGVGVTEYVEVSAVDPGMRVLRFASDADLRRALVALQADSNVKGVWRSSWNTADFTPSDPRYSEQWDKPIQNAEDAWDVETGVPANALIVISDGAARCAANPDISNCRQDLSADFFNEANEHWHGYHVAGIAAAVHNNLHIAGTAPTVQIALAGGLNAAGSGSSATMLLTINHAVELQRANPNRRVVLNMSWGGENFFQPNADALAALAAAGGIAVASAGNSTLDMCGTQKAYPASYPHVISVASTDSDDTMSSFSNFGNCSKANGGVLLAAPGGDPGVLSLDNTSTGTRLARGTSMAAPQVTGAIALALSQDPDLTENDIIERLEANSVPLGLPVISGGRLDLPGMLQEAEPGIRVSLSCPVPTEINQGSTLTCQAGTRGIGGFVGNVSLICGGVTGATCTASPATVAAGNGAVVRLVTTQSTPIGARTLTLTATGAGVDPATASVGVTVDPFGTTRFTVSSTEDAEFGTRCVFVPRQGRQCTLLPPAETSIQISQDLQILDLTGALQIIYFGSASNIQIVLTSAEGTALTVPPLIAGAFLRNPLAVNSNVFDGEGTQGEWTLRAEQLTPSGVQRIHRIDGWSLNIKAFPPS